jgi:hypothetical protein
MNTIESKEKPELEMKNVILKFPHLMEQIIQNLDDKSLVKSREAARIWKKLIDQRKYPWVRIVKFPTILHGGNTYLHLAAKDNQIDTFEVILNDEVDKNLVNDKGYTPFLVACLYGRVSIAELLMKKPAELKIDLSRKTNCNETAFHSACFSGNADMAEMIVENSDKLKIDLNEEASSNILCSPGISPDLMSGFESLFESDEMLREFFRRRQSRYT